jgi:hypothetical protein
MPPDPSLTNQPSSEGAGPWSDRSRGPARASSTASTPACKIELNLHVKVKKQ